MSNLRDYETQGSNRKVIEVVIKGPRGSGKTTFITNLLKRAGFQVSETTDFTKGYSAVLSNGAVVKIIEQHEE